MCLGTAEYGCNGIKATKATATNATYRVSVYFVCYITSQNIKKEKIKWRKEFNTLKLH